MQGQQAARVHTVRLLRCVPCLPHLSSSQGAPSRVKGERGKKGQIFSRSRSLSRRRVLSVPSVCVRRQQCDKGPTLPFLFCSAGLQSCRPLRLSRSGRRHRPLSRSLVSLLPVRLLTWTETRVPKLPCPFIRGQRRERETEENLSRPFGASRCSRRRQSRRLEIERRHWRGDSSTHSLDSQQTDQLLPIGGAGGLDVGPRKAPEQCPRTRPGRSDFVGT